MYFHGAWECWVSCSLLGVFGGTGKQVVKNQKPGKAIEGSPVAEGVLLARGNPCQRRVKGPLAQPMMACTATNAVNVQKLGTASAGRVEQNSGMRNISY